MRTQSKQIALSLYALFISLTQVFWAHAYTVVDTGQIACYDNTGEISCPSESDAFYGQDSLYTRNTPSYTDNGDGTVTDNNTGLMWQQAQGESVTYAEAVAGAGQQYTGGYTNWRLPTIKELYSLIMFSGKDPSGMTGDDTSGIQPFIDTTYFEFTYGDTSTGVRIIDIQFVSATTYTGTTMGNSATVFGLNLADGRIKGYSQESKSFYVRYVRGNTGYGINRFADNGDGTISDAATGLMWMQADAGPYDWKSALAYGQSHVHGGYLDWRLPNTKELQSIVDYTRSPSATSSAAIDPLFSVTPITDEGGGTNYPFYWSSTTHANHMPSDHAGRSAVYIAFGEALGWMQSPTGDYTLMDVHGAGAQRSDPKTGSASDYPYGHGPQGDVVRIENHVRFVRNINTDWEDSTCYSSDTIGFNAQYYLENNPDIAAAGYTKVTAEQHWESYGIQEGRQGSKYFSVQYYLTAYEDVRNAFGSDYNAAYMHFLFYGVYEGRRGSNAFDPVYYLEQYPDLKTAYGSDYHGAHLHWITYGVCEERQGVSTD